MKILIVGGSGLIGGHAALHLKAEGHEVTIMSRSKPQSGPLSELPHIAGSYIDEPEDSSRLQGFEAMVFAAAADIRNVPQDGSETPEAVYKRCNDEAVPRFFTIAKQAGIKRAVYIGSFYPTVVPERIEVDVYVRSRHVTDEAVRALASDDFTVCSLNAPFVLGHVPGLTIDYLYGMVAYASGQIEGAPIFAPEGGTNHISVKSLSEAIEGALLRGVSGRAYLVGDENLSWKQYLEIWFEACGNPQDLAVRADEHPLFPDVIMFAGRGATVSFEPEGVESLVYSQQRVTETIQEIVKNYTA